MSLVETDYQRLVAAMTPAERIERSVNLLAWAREVTGRRIIEELGEMSDDRLKWEVALRHYGHEPVMRKLIERELARVPH